LGKYAGLFGPDAADRLARLAAGVLK